MKVGVLTLGCKVNLYESEYVIHLLKEKGYEIKDFSDFCDVYIINTCTVTNTSDTKSRKMIHRAIRQNPNACVVAMGCFIEANKDYREDGLDIVIGTKDKSNIVNILDEWFKKRKEIRKLYGKDDKNDFEDMYIDNFSKRTRAFVKIQDGCENYCSYCIIPYVRGKCRSKDPNKVISEITSLVNNGYQEIVLTGIHTGNYGVDLDITFAELLQKIVKIPGLKRLRISSIEPIEITDEVLEVLKNTNIIVDHLHIPLQAGSDEILKLMNRKYDLTEYKNIIKKIRKIRPNISISTDIIVGFPNESESLFEETIKTVKEIGFSKIHVFPYSKRKNTEAANMENQVKEEEKKRRAHKLIEVSKDLENNYMNKFIGTEMEVLIENYKESYSYGHTSNFLHVKIKGEFKSNTFITVKLKEINYPYIIGEVIE